jgi:hypothetical protein
MKKIDIDTLVATMRVFLERTGAPLLYNDPANGEQLHIEPGAAAATDGLLPAIIVAGESVWRDVTGKGFELDLAHDPAALLGYQLRGIGGASFSIVMLASVESLHQVRRPEGLIINDFNVLWAAATKNSQDRAKSSARTHAGGPS